MRFFGVRDSRISVLSKYIVNRLSEGSTGWWKSRQALKQYDRAVRYSLIVSIKAPEVDIDLYTPIENQISVPILVSG